MSVDIKAVQQIQSKVVAAAADFDITDLQVQVNETEFFISVKGVKKGHGSTEGAGKMMKRMQAGVIGFKTYRTRMFSHCRKCRRMIKPGDVVVIIGSPNNYDVRLCRRCCGKVSKMFDEASSMK